ncbi:MAG: hypothetical protein IJR89_01780 [Clostridia bacterium]|nr:hypothetical protein [Clostridia bacterium]
MRGIDVSRWQGEIDWAAVGAAGVRFAMIKATDGEDADPFFAANLTGASGAGIACGTYHYLRATDGEGAIAEADRFADEMDPYREKIGLWAALDAETEAHRELGKEKLTDAVLAFFGRLSERGYKPMLYTNNDFIASCYDFDRLRACPIWLACWYDGGESDRPERDFAYQIWQQGITRVEGIVGNVDNDYGYFEMPDAFRPGEVVRIRPGSCYYGTEIPVPDVILEKTWIVAEVSGERVVLDRSADGTMAINSAVAAEDLIPVGNGDGGAEDPDAPDGDGGSGGPAAPPQSDPPAGETPPDGSAPDGETPEDPAAGQDADPGIEEDAAAEEAMERGLAAFFKMVLRALRSALSAVFGKKG